MNPMLPVIVQFGLEHTKQYMLLLGLIRMAFDRETVKKSIKYNI